MKKLLGIIKGNRGVVTVIMLIVLLGVGVLVLNTALNSQMNQSSSTNYKHKIQTFYAADGLMTMLAQEMIDTNENIYLIDKMSHQDIGSPTIAGSYAYDKINKIDTIKGAGVDIFGNSDQFHFLYTRVSGDLDISVKVVSTTHTDDWAKGGIMIREKLTGGSKEVMAERPYNPSNGVRLQWRTTENNSTTDPIIGTPDAPWVRLKRTGNVFNAYRSTNGSTWIFVNTVTVAMSDSVYAGLAVTSHNSGSLCTGVFSNLTGLVRRSCSDSTFVGSNNDVPVKYTINEMGDGIFSMTTQGYKVKGTTKTQNYISSLNQSLSRERNLNWYSSSSDSAFVPVTLYDMRADLSNPEFDVSTSIAAPCPPCNYGSGNWMVANFIRTDTLTADRKPIKKTPIAAFRTAFMTCWNASWYTATINDRLIATNIFRPSPIFATTFSLDPSFGWCFNDSMHTWFQPYGDSTGKTGTYTYDYMNSRWSGLKKRPGWTPGADDTEWVTQHWDSTKPFANIVMYDTIKFLEKPAPNQGVFTFGEDKTDSRWFLDCKEWNGSKCELWSATNSQKFMPLQNRGFGYDSRNIYPVSTCDSTTFKRQNFGFSMEIHRLFIYKKSQVFSFRGDDDVFVFINGKCVINLGGVHFPVDGVVNLDTLGLTEGNQYMFDFFYLERCPTGSNILITTNMLLFTPPQANKRNWKRDYGNID